MRSEVNRSVCVPCQELDLMHGEATNVERSIIGSAGTLKWKKAVHMFVHQNQSFYIQVVILHHIHIFLHESCIYFSIIMVHNAYSLLIFC